MFHENGDDDIDQDKLGHQDENDEKNRGDDARHATILDAIGRRIAILSQRVLHDAVPVVARSHAEQRQKSDSKVGKVSVFAESLARMVVVAFWQAENANKTHKETTKKQNVISSWLVLAEGGSLVLQSSNLVPSRPNNSTPRAAKMKNSK